MTEFNRRATDKITEEILELIKKEEREPEKGTLLILYQISDLIASNTRLVHEMHDTLMAQNSAFEQHKEKSMEYLNKGKGAWRVLAIALVAFKMVLLGMLSFLYSDYSTLKKRVAAIENIKTVNISAYTPRNINK